jgi:hypothetical protein
MSDMNEEPVDLSALDATADAARWEAFLVAAMMRADATLAARMQTPADLIASWSRPLLLAAAVVVALLVPLEILLEARETRTQQIERLVTLSVDWANGGAAPSGSQLRGVLIQEVRP